MLWEGYGLIAPGVLAHPSARTEELIDILQTAGAHDKVVALQARTLGALSSRPLRDIVDQCWRLGEVAAEYQDFVEAFRPVARAMRGSSIEPDQCFVVRTLLMHEFRRVQLRDPLLPRQLLPADWPGETARALCRDIYAACWRDSEAHLMSALETADGPLPAAGRSIQSRFAGLDSTLFTCSTMPDAQRVSEVASPATTTTASTPIATLAPGCPFTLLNIIAGPSLVGRITVPPAPT